MKKDKKKSVLLDAKKQARTAMEGGTLKTTGSQKSVTEAMIEGRKRKASEVLPL